MANYLSLPAIADFITQYEENPTTENLKIMVSCLLTYAFDPENGWFMKWQEDEVKGHSNCFIMKIDGDKKTLHAVIKIVLNPSGSISINWDQSIPHMLTAPIPDDRCWALLVRGLKVRLYEYHRTQNPDYRLIPCDFKINDKPKHTVHIRNNANEVHNILVGIPEQVPQPLDELEVETLSLKDSPDDDTESKNTADDTDEVVANSEEHPDPSLGNSSDLISEATPAVEVDPVDENEPVPENKPITETEPAAQTKSATKLKASTTTKTSIKTKSTAQVKSVTGAKSTQAKAALLAKAAAGIKPTSTLNSRTGNEA